MKFKFAGVDKSTSVVEALYDADGLSAIHDEDLDKLLTGASILSQEEVSSENGWGVPYSYFEGEVDVPLVRDVFEFAGEGTDCDVCGWGPAEATLVVTDVGDILKTQYGCYHGSYISTFAGNPADTEQWLRDELDHIRVFMVGPFTAAFRALDE